MTISRKKKEIILNDISLKISEAKILIFAKYSGIISNDLTKLRKKARKKNVYLYVLKNTLMRRIIKNTKFSPLINKISGHLIYIFSRDIIKTSKIFSDFYNLNNKLCIKYGFCCGKIINGEDVIEISNLQSKEKLISRLLFLFKYPLLCFINILENIKNINNK